VLQGPHCLQVVVMQLTISSLGKGDNHSVPNQDCKERARVGWPNVSQIKLSSIKAVFMRAQCFDKFVTVITSNQLPIHMYFVCDSNNNTLI